MKVAVAVGAALLATGLRAAGAAGSPEQFAIEVFRVSDGLPGDSVQALAQAADGQLWIATLGGLARYDGIRFQRVQGPSDGRATAIDVRRLLSGRDGSIWAGSPYFAPVRFFGTQAPAGSERLGWPASAGTLAWTEDEAGHPWMTDGPRLWQFADGRFAGQPLAGLAGRPTELQLDGAGTLWIGTERGLYRRRDGQLTPHPALPGDAAVSALHLDRRGVLWAAAGAHLYALEDGRTRTFSTDDGLPAEPIVALADDDAGLWFGGPGGLGRVTEGEVHRLGAADGLPAADVTALLVDREGSLWVGTGQGGLVQLSARTLSTRDLPPEIADREVYSLCEDAAGAWWFGTAHGALRWLHGRASTFTRADGLPSDFVPAILPGDHGDVWVGTMAGLRLWQQGAIVDPGSWPGAVTALYRDRRGVLWIGGNGELGRLEGTTLTVLGPQHGLPARQVRAVAEDAAGAIWVSGVGGPVVRWESGRFVRPELLRGLRASPVRSMITDRAGGFWLSVDRSGLIRVGRDGVQTFDARQGLEAEILYQLLEDDGGDLWLGTNKSVLRMSRASLDAVADGRRPTLEIVSFETTDRRAGVVASAIRQPSAWKGRDGRLRFATQRGVVEIDPHRVRPNPVRPQVVIEAALADGRALATDGAQVPPRPGRLEIHYAARALLEPTKVRYRYRLEGFDAGWIEAGAARVASYTALPAGTYQFRVQASNNDRLWNERGASLAVVVASPLYRRPWFYLLCTLGLVPVGLVLHRLRLSRLHAHYLGVFTERNRVARELHDTLLQGMSGIAMQLRSIRARLEATPDSDEARRDLARLQDTVTRNLDEARRMVWDLRDRGRRDGTLGPALARFARRLFRNARTAYDLKIDGAARHLPNAVEDELFRIAQESLRNAVAHAQATLVRIGLCYDVDRVVLTISDDGVGFDPAASDAEARGHFGLAGLRERAARIGATLDVRSAPGTGTTIEVVAPAPGGSA